MKSFTLGTPDFETNANTKMNKRPLKYDDEAQVSRLDLLDSDDLTALRGKESGLRERIRMDFDCNDLDDEDFYAKPQLRIKRNVCSEYRYHRKVENFLHKMRNHYTTKKEPIRISYADEPTHKFVCYMTSLYVKEIDRKTASKYTKTNNTNYKYYTEDDNLFIFVTPTNWKPQFMGFDFFQPLNTIISMLQYTRRTANTILTGDFGLFLLDVVRFLIDLREGYFSVNKILSSFISLFIMHRRYTKMFPQTTTTTDLLIGLAALQLPTCLLDKLKNFAMLTGKKVFDNDFILDTVSVFFDTIISMLDYIITLENPLIPTFLAASIKRILSNVGSKFVMYKRMKEVAEVYSSYCRDSTRMFDPVFRQKITELHDKCVGDAVFIEFVTNGTNNYFKTTWNLFKENIVKTVTSFESSSRDEPILFIFEGEAGTGKSVIMNMMVDLFRAKGVSVYSHSFPPLVAGKDFWDDYAGQYLMVVDDIGQRSKDQLGMIINLVSPVKYPLACANASLKNTKFFNSKLIFMTTNSFMNLGGFTSTDGISCPEALFRRAHVVKVDRISQPGEVFNQRLSYHKFDFRGEKKWVNRLLYHNAGDLPLIIETVKDGVADQTAALKFVYRLVSHVERTDEADRKHLVPNQGFYEDIIRNVELENRPAVAPPTRIVMTDEEFVDAIDVDPRKFVAQGWADGLLIPLVDSYDYIASVIREAMEFITVEAKKIWETFASIIVESQAGSTVRDIVFKHKYTLSTALAGGTFLFLIIGILRQFWTKEKIDMNEVMKVSEKDVDMLKMLTLGDNDRINSIKRFCKTVHVKEDSLDRTKDRLTQAIVSGDKIMFPCHSQIEGKVLDIYTTWDHWLNGHKEMENIEVKLIKSYLSVDIAIYQITKAIPLWKLCHNIFPQQQQNNPLHYLVNSAKTQEVILGLSVIRNDQSVNYSGYRNVSKTNFLGVPYEAQELFNISHKPGAGYFTGVSSEGFCGTALCSTDGGIVGFHVAGTPDDVGFVVVPPRDIADDIRKIMTSSREVKFEIDRRIVPGQSGVRLRYETPMEVRYTGGDSSFVKTIFHRDHNEDIKNLEDSIFQHTKSTTVAPKKPPDFKAMGKPVTLLKKMAQKTMSHQGHVTDEELAYIFECLEPLVPYFDDVDDMTVAFGGEGLQPLNKDSSNGYGCLKSKLDYFDFDSKEIRDVAREGIERFRKAAEEEDYSPEHFVCIETFKDELRTIPKATSPRTFRVMPLFHIWWTKKLFGKLIPHFKDNVHVTGICIGLNPYKDFDTIYKRLKPCHIHGDIDFGKWDGSINARIMQTIGDIFLQKYRGKHGYMIKYLFNTMTTSMTMVSDELISTTHGLPSGTWLTLLLNCLLNKSLTALTMFRNWDCSNGLPSYAEFNEIVDYVTGDDKIFGSPHEFKDIINLHTIAEVAKSLGMDCTNGDKTPIVSPHRPLNDLNYVKRDFTYHPQLGTYVGALSVDTIMNTLQWYDSKKDLNECIEGKMKSVQVEAYLHSRSFYYSLTSIFKKQYPQFLFFDEDKVKKILKSDTGYIDVMAGLGKDMSFHN